MSRDEDAPERISFWRSDGPDGIEILRGRYHALRFAPHAHDRYLLAAITTGALEIADPGRRAVADAGHVVLYNHDQLHWGHAAGRDGWSISSVYLPPDFLHRTSRELGAPARGTIGFPHIAAADRTLAAKIVALCSDAGPVGDNLARESLLAAILAEALARHADRYVRLPAAPHEPRAVRIARAFIEANHASPVSLARLSALCGIGRYWLIKAFKASHGVTPYAYLTDIRVRHALALLRTGTPVAEAALACGFSDQSHLSRMLKRSTGITPGLFRSARDRRGTGKD